MNLSFKNRIAFNYLIATAFIIAMVFGFVYLFVQCTVYQNLDEELSFEAKKHSQEIKIVGDSVVFINKAEWEETEHREIQVNPVFIQLVDKKGQVTDKSPNLKLDALSYQTIENGEYQNSTINSQKIRQIQIPIEQRGEIKGYLLAGISSEAAHELVDKLKSVLIISFLAVLIGLYFISRFLAGRSIVPVRNMTDTIQRITKNNLNERVTMPHHKDEIYKLSTGFNELLDRIESALIRERQFTSDASHELRTPLSSLRGTLEVLVRKERTTQEYEEKINFSLLEIDKMSLTIDQLLQLARIDQNTEAKYQNFISHQDIIEHCIQKLSNEINEKKVTIEKYFNCKSSNSTSEFHTKLILENILSNAIKYSNTQGKITITFEDLDHRVICKIHDNGIGIAEKDLETVFDSFFRSNPMEHREIEGNGLGLAIAKKAAQAIDAEIKIQSSLGQGTTVSIIF